MRLNIAATGFTLLVSAFLAVGCGGGGPDVTFHDGPLNDAGPTDIHPASLFGSGKCQLPSCDKDASAGVSLEGNWRRILQTTGSNCGSVIKNTDDRAKKGARNEMTESIPPLRGTCLYHDGKRVGTVRDGMMARCISESRRQGVTSYSAEVVDFSGDVGTGRVRTYLRGIPSIAGGDCRIDRDVRFERK